MKTINSVHSIILLGLSMLAAQNGPDTLYCTEVDIESLDEYGDMITGGCNLGCAIGWSYDVSSYLESHSEITYGPENLCDGNLQTAWVEGADGHGIGEEIIITFDIPDEIENINFDGIEFINGYTKTPGIWEKNSRVKTFKVWFNEELLFYIHALDSDWPQTIHFGEKHTIYLNQGDVVYLEIAEVYPGSKYTDTAITEMTLHGGH